MDQIQQQGGLEGPVQPQSLIPQQVLQVYLFLYLAALGWLQPV